MQHYKYFLLIALVVSAILPLSCVPATLVRPSLKIDADQGRHFEETEIYCRIRDGYITSKSDDRMEDDGSSCMYFVFFPDGSFMRTGYFTSDSNFNNSVDNASSRDLYSRWGKMHWGFYYLDEQGQINAETIGFLNMGGDPRYIRSFYKSLSVTENEILWKFNSTDFYITQISKEDSTDQFLYQVDSLQVKNIDPQKSWIHD